MEAALVTLYTIMDKWTSNQVNIERAAADLFSPRIVAVVGASPEPDAVTSRPLHFLKTHGFRGKLYAVNPRHQVIEGIRCYPSVAELPERPDAAMIGVPASRLEMAVADCATRRVPLVSIFTGAVPEQDKQRLLRIVHNAGTRILGPNSLGFVNAHENLVCTYSQAALLARIPKGGLSIVSQSGGLAGCLLNRAVDAGIGIARFVTPGASADIDLAELIEHLAGSPETRAVAAIVESVTNGFRFIRAVERLQVAGKRIVLWRIGRSTTGRAAAVSHTGALAGDERIFGDLCRDAGVVQTNSLDELLEVAGAAAARRPPAGKSVGIVTSSGGAAIIVADALEDSRLTIPPLSAETADSLRNTLPPTATIANPLDIGAGQGPQAFRAGVEAMLSDPAFDCIVLALTMVAGKQATRVLPELIGSTKNSERPLAVVWPAGSLAAPWRRRLRRNGVAVFERADFAAAAIRQLAHGVRASMTPILAASALAGPANAIMAGPAGLRTEWQTRKMLATYAVESPPEALVQTAEQAIEAARRIGFPVALKAQSSRLPHRAQAGALALDLRDEQSVAESFRKIVSRLDDSVKDSLDGLLVQAMVEPESEVFLGMVRDPAFGPVIACGQGGVNVESEHDIGFVLPSGDPARFAAWLGSQPIGARIGAVGIATVARLMVQLSQAIADLGAALIELDINPVALVAGHTRALALDALAVMSAADNQIASGATS